MYGEKEPRYALCDLSANACVRNGTSTADLFPEFTEKEYVLSKDGTLALVFEGSGNASRYDLHAVGTSTSRFVSTIDYTGEVRRAYFSGDSKKILFVTMRGEFVVFDIAANVATKSIPIVGGASFVTFSSHGRYIAYYSPNTSSRNERTYTLVDIERDITYFWKERNTYWDLLSEEERIFAFSPDERHFVYLSDRDGYQTLYAARLWMLDGGTIKGERVGKRMFASNFTVNDLLFGVDGRLYFIANRANPLAWALYAYRFDGQSVEMIADRVAYWPPAQSIGGTVVFLRSMNDLPQLFLWNTGTNVLGALPTPLDAAFPLANGVIKNFSGRYGVLYMPDGYDKTKAYPLIVWLHGGPSRQTSTSFHPYHSYGTYDALLEHLRKNGFIVLKLDYRGSYGYGKSFAESLKGNVGKLDVKDVVDATAALKKSMRIGEVYPMGTSYGGYLALRALAGKPSLFAGAISVNGVTDWWTLIKNNPSSIFKVHFNGPPSSKNKILYDQASIFLRLNNLKNKKIVLVQGEEDATVPHRQTTMLYDALTDRGINATIISYEKEGHVLTDSANIDDLCNRVVALPNGYADKVCVPGI